MIYVNVSITPWWHDSKQMPDTTARLSPFFQYELSLNLWQSYSSLTFMWHSILGHFAAIWSGFGMDAGVILVMGSANERQRYIVTSSLIGWAHTQNYPLGFYLISRPMGVTGSPDTQGILTIMQASYMEQVNIICESIEMNKKND